MCRNYVVELIFVSVVCSSTQNVESGHFTGIFRCDTSTQQSPISSSINLTIKTINIIDAVSTEEIV